MKGNIIWIVFAAGYDVKTNFLLSIMQDSNPEHFPLCSDGRDVTGYFVPVEEDYSGQSVTIILNEESRELR